MALTLTKEPEVISLSKDPMVYEFQTDNMVVSAGTAAVNKITFTSGVAVDDVIVISWAGQELRMVAKAVPVLSNEFLAGTSDLNVLLPYFRDNYTIEKDFVVSIVSGKIDLTARNAGTKYNLSSVSFEGGTINTTVTGVDSVVRKNFGVYFEVWVQKADGTDAVKKIHDDVIPVDRLTSRIDVDISQILHSELVEDLPWEFVANAGLCVKSKRKYYLRYAEVFGEKSQVQRLVLGATKHVVMGGSSLIGRKTVVGLLQGVSAATDACMRIGDTTRYILQGEEQYLYFLATRANVAPKLMAVITYSDDSTETKYSAVVTALRYNKVYFKATLSVFEPNTEKTVVQYVVRVVDADNANAVLSKDYTYVIDYSVRRSVRNFFYVNSLGAVDEFATFGKGSTEIEFYKESAEKAVSDLGIEAQEEDYNIESREFFEAATGFRSKRELAYMRDFFLSSRKYVKNIGKWLPIIVANKRVKEREDGQNLNGYKFEYALAYRDDSLSDSDLSEIIGYPLPPQGFLGGGNVTVSITEPAGIIIDAVPTIGSSNAVSSNGVAVALATKQNLIAVGTELQYIRGDGTLGTLGSEVGVLGGSVFEDKWSVKNNEANLALGYGSGNVAIGNFENDSLTKILGRFGIQNSTGFLGQFSVANLTANTTFVLPNNNVGGVVNVNDFNFLLNKPANITAVAGLTGAGLAKRLSDGSWQLDATVYATEANLSTNYQAKLVGDGYVKMVGGATTYVNKEFVDISTAQDGIAGAKKFTTSIQSPIVVIGTDSRNITISNISGTSPRIASNYTLDFYSPTQFDWITGGSIGRMRLIPTGLRVGSTSDPLYQLHVSGTTGLDGLISVGKTSDGIAMSSGSVGQFLRRSYVSNGYYSVNTNNWANILAADISDLAASWNASWDTKMALPTLNFGATAQALTIKSATKFEQNIEFSPTIANVGLVFGNGYFKNNTDGDGFEYKSSSSLYSISGSDYRIGNFRFNQLTANRTWGMPDYNGTLTTYEKVNAEFWKLGGNSNITADAVFDINPGGTAYNYIWKIANVQKMQLTAQGNLSVGGIAPEAVIHAHANVVGNAEVIALKASNNVTSAYFSIGIDSTNNRTNLYSGGEVWATTISKFKFGAADVSGLWTYSVIPQTTADATTGNQLVRLSQVQTLLSGGFAVSTSCKLVFTDNQSLSGAKTQGGYTTLTNDFALFVGQSASSENGVRKYNGSTWVRPSENDSDSKIRGKGHLITAGSYAGSQWVNTNSSAITIDSTAITYVQWTASETDPTVPNFAKSLTSAAQLLTEIKTVDGVASGLDSQYLGGYNYDNYARKSENATISGNWTFDGAVTVAVASAAGNATRKDYVDAGLATKVSINGNAYGAAFAIGTTDAYNLALMRGSVTQAVLRSDGIGDIKRIAVGRSTGFGNTFWDGVAVFGGNVVIGGNNSAIQASYDLNMVAHTTMDNANNGTRKSRIKFGYYNSADFVNNYTRGIEYSRADNSIVIGSYSAISDTSTTAPTAGSSFYFSSTGQLAIGQADYESKKLLVNGNARIKGELDLTGRLSLNGSYGVDHQFVKYNGTSTVWAVLNTGELEDGADIVKYSTMDSERGIPFYSDAEKTTLDAQISINADAGIALGIYGYKFINEDTSNAKQFGMQLNKTDGKLYHYTLDGTQERILTTADDLGGGNATWNGGVISQAVKIGSVTPILWGSTSVVSITNYGGKMEWGINLQSQVFANGVGGILLESTSQLFLGATEDIWMKGRIHMNGIELDMAKVAALIGV